jgi:predicted transcriptional regulator
VTLDIRLTPDQEEQLNQVANAQGRSRHDCVHQALDDYLARHGGNAALRSEETWSELIPEWSDWTA